MKVYFQFLPEGIVVRRKGDGPIDPIVRTITPEALIELAEIVEGLEFAREENIRREANA